MEYAKQTEKKDTVIRSQETRKRCKGCFIIYMLHDVSTLLNIAQPQKTQLQVSLTVLKQVIFELLKRQCTAGGT